MLSIWVRGNGLPAIFTYDVTLYSAMLSLVLIIYRGFLPRHSAHWRKKFRACDSSASEINCLGTSPFLLALQKLW